MKRIISRRRFVGATAASAFSFTFLPARIWGANERLNVAAIGCGGKGRSDIEGAAGAGCEIVALCDVDFTRAADAVKAFPNAKRYADYRVLFDRQRDIDAVTVSTPDHHHAPASMMAMKLGKHVYCQKPLSHSVFEARAMAETARRQGVATQMGNQAHAGEPIRRGVEWIRAGIIGDVIEVHVWTNRPIWPQGIARPVESAPPPDHLAWDIWLGPAPHRPYHPDYHPFKWRGWWDFGTGALGDMACHIMDMPYWALELGAPDTVSAESGGGTPESAPLWSTITYEFPGRGNRPPTRLIWYDGRRNGTPNLPPADVLEGQDPGRFGCVMIGRRGKLFFNRRNTDWITSPESLLTDFQPPAPSLPRVRNEDEEWVAACKSGPKALSNFDYAGALTETVLLGNVAIRLGRPIRWDANRLQAIHDPAADEFIRRTYRSGWTL